MLHLPDLICIAPHGWAFFLLKTIRFEAFHGALYSPGLCPPYDRSRHFAFMSHSCYLFCCCTIVIDAHIPSNSVFRGVHYPCRICCLCLSIIYFLYPAYHLLFFYVEWLIFHAPQAMSILVIIISWDLALHCERHNVRLFDSWDAQDYYQGTWKFWSSKIAGAIS